MKKLFSRLFTSLFARCPFCKQNKLWFQVKKRTYTVQSVPEMKGIGSITSELPMCNTCFNNRPIK